MAVPTGTSMPPPMPCTTRNAISAPMFHDRPHSPEPRVNMARANRNTRLVPMRSPNQPEAGIQTARLRM
jgi:hypothetical protein